MTPVDEIDVVAVAPKYAWYAESIDDDALENCCRAVHVFAFARLSHTVCALPPL